MADLPAAFDNVVSHQLGVEIPIVHAAVVERLCGRPEGSADR